MARILAVGNATLDIILRVDRYPQEDQELRALSQQQRRGGNAGNTLVVLSQLGHRCSWAGTLSVQPETRVVLDDFDHYAIDHSGAEHIRGCTLPTSYITLSAENGSRTIVHTRDLPEYQHQRFITLPLSDYDWIHFEGRNGDQLARMLDHLHHHHAQLRYSIEIEKPRPAIEALFDRATLLLFSREYARHRGHSRAEPLLQAVRQQGAAGTLVCSWGEQGASALDNAGNRLTLPAYRPKRVVDTLAAGDTFNAGMIDGLCRGEGLMETLASAIELAGRKCGQYGLALKARS